MPPSKFSSIKYMVSVSPVAVKATKFSPHISMSGLANVKDGIGFTIAFTLVLANVSQLPL